MKKALCLIMLLMACPLFAQQRQVRVRLFSTQLPSAVRVVPQRDASIDGAPLKTATTISVQSGRIAIQQKPTAARAIRVTGTFVLEASDGPSVRLRQPLTIGIDGDRLRLVISEPLEDYVAAVLAGEAGAFKSIEALKAMAVAIRTFAIRFEGERHRGESFDFCDTTHCQDFHIGGITDQLRSAVDATEGEIVWFDGRPAATYYHQDCGGHTEAAGSVWPNARAPYLSSRQDPYCLAKGGANWVADVTPDELRQATGATAVVVSS